MRHFFDKFIDIYMQLLIKHNFDDSLTDMTNYASNNTIPREQLEAACDRLSGWHGDH